MNNNDHLKKELTRGLLLVNLGTPKACNSRAVRSFLKEFLSDNRVISLPSFFRYLLLYGIILPFRTRKTTHAYQSIWTEQGSPLLIFSQQFQIKLQQNLGGTWKVALGMRYGAPSLEEALETLSDCESITVLPLYPQYSSSATGSAIERVLNLLSKRENFPFLHFIPHFYKHSAFIQAQASLIKPHINSHDFILFSYHSIPTKHLPQITCKVPCISDCTKSNNSELAQFQCYQAQCYATSQSLAKSLELDPATYSTSFQSRIGKTPWIKPFTDRVLPELIKKGVKRLLVVCPSFTVDCLETLEEINIRAKKQWQELGGIKLTQVSCVNDNPIWVKNLSHYLNSLKIN